MGVNPRQPKRKRLDLRKVEKTEKKCKIQTKKKKKEALGGMEQTRMAGREMSKERLKKRILSKATKAGKEQNENDSFKVGRQRRKKSEGIVLTEHEHIVNDFPDRR